MLIDFSPNPKPLVLKLDLNKTFSSVGKDSGLVFQAALLVKTLVLCLRDLQLESFLRSRKVYPAVNFRALRLVSLDPIGLSGDTSPVTPVSFPLSLSLSLCVCISFFLLIVVR